MTQNSNIINHWSFLAFAKEKGADLATGECVNHETGETFNACTFSKDGKRTFVNFGPSLEGGLSIDQMIARRNELQVLQMEVKPEVIARRQKAGKQTETYILCKVGESSWQSVDLSAYLQ